MTRFIIHHPSFIILGLSLIVPAVVGGSVPPTTAEGFLVPQPGAELSFPADHGSHPDYKIEWWYLTGHLAAESGREFGFQATFFRSALRPPEERADGGEAFGDDQLYLAHMAVTDVDGERFHHEERLNRGGWDADAAVGELDVRNGNWSLRALGEAAEHPMQLVFTVEDEVAVDLVLTPRKALLRFGEDGTSRKGADPTARSFYLTWSRLAAEGTVVLGEETLAVTGQAWMDHEIASQQLGDDLAGWDWTAIHLEDGWEVKAYILRREDGSPSPFSALMWIDPEGKVAYRGAEAFTWETAQWWTSPETGARYPVGVDLTTEDPRTGESITFALRPRLAAQELSTGSAGFAYWEGACTVQGAGGEHVGLAYLELVGYGGEATRGLR